MRKQPKIYHAKDAWRGYANQLLALNPDWWGKYHLLLDNYYIYRRVESDGKMIVEEVFSYAKFRQILDEFFIAAKQAVIEGEAVNLGNCVGKVCARRVERDHSNPQINWGRTALQPKVFNEKTGKMAPKKLIYFTEDDYCRIGLHKTGRIKNETVYEFAPTRDNKTKTGFRQEFAAALSSNMLLRFRYLYFPLHTEKKAQLKKETADYNAQKQAQ